MIRSGPTQYQDYIPCVARERFDIPKLEKIGEGSDRDVYLIGDHVLKIAKTARGLAQNSKASYMISGTAIPKIIEKGDNYNIFEKVAIYGELNDTEKRRVDELVQSVQDIGPAGYVGSSSPRMDRVRQLESLFDTMGWDNLSYFKTMYFGDIKQENLGMKDGKIYLMDEGVIEFGRVFVEYLKKENEDFLEFRDVYARSMRWKEHYKDNDDNDMY